MSELLIELFSEEIPASQQKFAAELFQQQIVSQLKNQNLECDSKYFHSPRRIIFFAENLPKYAITPKKEIRGPKVSAKAQAIEGFIKKSGLKTQDQLIVKLINKEEYYFFEKPEEKIAISQLLPQIITDALDKLSNGWNKTMRWSNYKLRWIRPLHNIAVIYDGKNIQFDYYHLTTNNQIYSHRFIGKESEKVTSFKQYQEFLNKNYVIFDQNQRKNIILDSLKKIASFHDAEFVEDEYLLDEVNGLVEFPNILSGKFDKEFLAIPKEALISVMKKHQRYFALIDKDGNLINRFLFAANMNYSHSMIESEVEKQVIMGNERVLTARFNDAKFFYEQDQKISLSQRHKLLENIVFHQDIGSMQDKVKHIIALAKFISVFVPNSNLLLVERAAALCKCDLTSSLVQELPDLQGIAGYYYAINDQESKEVATAIKSHYMPIGSKGKVPTEAVSISVALADKIDSLAALFIADEKPTGSKDPYGLRRLAIAIINIIIENKISFSLKIMIAHAVNNYSNIIKKKHKTNFSELFTNKNDEIINEIFMFLMERFKGLMKNKNIANDLVEAVYDNGNQDDLYVMFQKVSILSESIKDEEFLNVVATYKRAHNIFSAEDEFEKKYKQKILKISYKLDVEKDLFDLNKKLNAELSDNIKNANFKDAFENLNMINDPVEIFFDEVLINDPDPNIRENRLKLLASLCRTVNKLANLSYIKTK